MHIRFSTFRFISHRLDPMPRKKWQPVTLWRPRFGRLDGEPLSKGAVLLLPGRWLTLVSQTQHGRIWKKAPKVSK
jgi:hypothetical protein